MKRPRKRPITPVVAATEDPDENLEAAAEASGEVDETTADENANDVQSEADEAQDKTSIDDLVDQLESSGDAQKNYGAASVDDVIAQARAAAAVDAPTPSVLNVEKSSTSANVEAALSSVREVEVDPDDPDVEDAEDDDAQAAIDRALMALDREAEGKHDANADEALLDESSSGAISAATRDKPELIEDSQSLLKMNKRAAVAACWCFWACLCCSLHYWAAAPTGLGARAMSILIPFLNRWV